MTPQDNRAPISETDIMNYANLPECMADSLDKPWEYVGELNVRAISINILCDKCSTKKMKAALDIASVEETIDLAAKEYLYFVVVNMKSHLFIKPDFSHGFVYFGECEECKGVFWATNFPGTEEPKEPE